MNHLLRSLAPISDAGWKLDEEARERLTARWPPASSSTSPAPTAGTHSATNLGRINEIASAPCDGVNAAQRRVLPLVELRADFEISLAELRDLDRGAEDVDLDALDAAAHQIAVAENVAVLHGWEAASITGISEASPHQPFQLGDVADGYPRPVASAVEQLLQSGVSGPYALALGRDQYTRVVETAEHGGYPLLDHLKQDPRRPDRLGPRGQGRGRAQPSRRGLPVRVRPGSVDRLRRPRRRCRPPVPRGELQLPRGHARGRGRLDHIAFRGAAPRRLNRPPQARPWDVMAAIS